MTWPDSVAVAPVLVQHAQRVDERGAVGGQEGPAVEVGEQPPLVRVEGVAVPRSTPSMRPRCSGPSELLAGSPEQSARRGFDQTRWLHGPLDAEGHFVVLYYPPERHGRTGSSPHRERLGCPDTAMRMQSRNIRDTNPRTLSPSGCCNDSVVLFDSRRRRWRHTVNWR